MSDILTVLTTAGSESEAEALARSAVGARLAACAQVNGPVTSVYRWEGETHADPEWQVLFKSTAARYPELESHLRREHPYDVPEIIATPVTRGSAAYLDWVRTETAA